MKAMSRTQGRERLIDYIQITVERLTADGFEAGEEELSEKIMPSVASSIKRLSSGAPQEARANLKQCLLDAEVLPDYQCDLTTFVESLHACLEVLGAAEAEPDDDADEDDGDDNLDPDPEPSAEELESLQGVISRLWAIEENYRLMPGEDGYQLSHGSRAASLESMSDRCPDPLFDSVNSERLLRNPCTRTFLSLLDNYSRETDAMEEVTDEEQREMDQFLAKLMATPHMKYVHKVLTEWKSISHSYGRFGTEVFKVWFEQYSLHGYRGAKSSSGFEHVFVGEEKEDPETGSSEIIGLHNWVQFYHQERKGLINYKGYVGCLTDDDERLVSVRFGWDDDDAEAETKNVSTFLVGTSLAFEFSLLTLAFFAYDGECKQYGLWFGDVGPVNLITYSWNTPCGRLLRSAYLET